MRDPFNYTWLAEFPDRFPDMHAHTCIGSMPTSGHDIDTLASMGVRAILSLTRRNIQDCDDIRDAIAKHKIVHQWAPIEDGNVPSEEILQECLDFLRTVDQVDVPYYIHCRGGIGRSGIILIAHYILQRHRNLEQAQEIVRARRNCHNTARAGAVGSPQREWVERLSERLNTE